MAITRTPQVDDDGSGSTGTLWTNAWKQELYNQIDAALIALPALTEGTWVPGLTFFNGAVGMTYSTQYGFYVKVGRAVFFEGRVVLTSKGTSTGQLDLTNLPVMASGAPDLFGGVSVTFHSGFTGITGGLTGYVLPLTTRARLVWHSTATVDLIDTNVTNSLHIIFHGFYFAA